MGMSYWFRAAILVVSFVVVCLAMYSINHKGINPNIAGVFTDDGTRTAKVLPKRVDLCATRVKSLKTAQGVELAESGMTWVKKKGGVETKLDPVEVEKWFGHNCSPKIEDLRPVASTELQAATPILTLNFIQGASETIRKSPSGSYIWKQISFHSQQLDNALNDLLNLREAGPEGTAKPSRD
jgi:hypothetical protein